MGGILLTFQILNLILVVMKLNLNFDDLKNINILLYLTSLCSEQSKKLETCLRKLNDFDLSKSELILDDQPMKNFLLGNTFMEVGARYSTEKLELIIREYSDEITLLENRLSSNKLRLEQIRNRLYSKFGTNFNLCARDH